ncbi:MAG: hypothetical protein ACR2IE_07095 [Candidatus Sumerlaeaceae bacterium]
MSMMDRRQFLADVGAGAVVLTANSALRPVEQPSATPVQSEGTQHGTAITTGADPKALAASKIDFRYAPRHWRTAICFPDDSNKTLVGDKGDLQYAAVTVEFALAGMEPQNRTRQSLEAPQIPVLTTEFETAGARYCLTTFATQRASEGRVDNVLMEIWSTEADSLDVVPILTMRTIQAMAPEKHDSFSVIRSAADSKTLFFAADAIMRGCTPIRGDGFSSTDMVKTCEFVRGTATKEKPHRIFFRFPQQGQDLEKIRSGISQPEALLDETRLFWKKWKPLAGNVGWEQPKTHTEFLTACARNILQAREVKDGKLTFQVGALDYRGLWIVDGNFILEAARYLGYDEEAQQGLEATWAKQRKDGGVFAGAGDNHWKDTSIALFTLVRQAELAQNWDYFRQMQPNILRAIQFVRNLREKARSQQGPSGRYGLLVRGSPDGGIAGDRHEFTNTLWTLAGLKAVAEAAEIQGLTDLSPARALYTELRTAFDAAAKQEMRRHPSGFEYLHMLMKEDELWTEPDEWYQPRPQSAQWALSHAIAPGNVFAADDPVTQGHIRLMQACTKEDVPVETGWSPHQGVWTYNAAFVAQVYLWAGMPEWAHRTFAGFLNHATSLYTWKEEQPLRGSFTGALIGDMPHNWASAECIRYLRHMLALEDGVKLRLLAGITDSELSYDSSYSITESPTRFGRVSLRLAPQNSGKSWRLEFRRSHGPAPAQVRLPARLGSRFVFAEAKGAADTRDGQAVLLTPEAASWSATWTTG